MNKPVIIIGNGGHASVLAETLMMQKREIIGYTAPVQGDCFYGLLYLGTDKVIEDFESSRVELVLGLGMITVSSIRSSVFQTFKNKGYRFAKVIHPSAILSTSVKFDEGVQVMAGAIIQANCRLGRNTIINTGSILDHDCVIGDHAHIAPGVTLSGGVRIGQACHIGTGTSIIQGIRIGNYSLIGAGSVVVKDIADNQKAYGVPAREV